MSDTLEGVPVAGWASKALNQACTDKNWLPLCDILHGKIKHQLEGNLVSKRFSELTDVEQASLVEHHYRQLQIRGNKEHLDPFLDVLNRAVDEELLSVILKKSLNKEALERRGFLKSEGDTRKKKEEEDSSNAVIEEAKLERELEGLRSQTTLEYLMGEISGAVIEMLERSEPALQNTLSMFLNRPLPTQLRLYVWSKSLRLDHQRLEDGTSLFAGRMAPSIDLLLSRRCHALLDVSFPVVSSRANASFVKAIVSNFMRLTGMKVPDTASDNFDDLENLIYLMIPLLVLLRSNVHDLVKTGAGDQAAEGGNTEGGGVAGGGGSSGGTDPGGGLLGHELPSGVQPGSVEFFEDNYTTNIGAKINATKRINMMENALYSLLEPRYLGLMELVSSDSTRKVNAKKRRPGDAEEEENASASDKLFSAGGKATADRVSGTFSFTQKAPGMGQAVTLLSAKDDLLAKLLTRLEMHGGGGAGEENDGGYGALSGGKGAGRVQEHKIKYYLLSQSTNWTDFMNEMLLRGLSGLLNLEVTLFVWDQGFVTDFGAILPLTLVSLILGAGPEIRSLVSYKNAVETFISYCRSVTVEQLEALLMEHCGNEMHELVRVSPSTADRDDLVMQDTFRHIELNM